MVISLRGGEWVGGDEGGGVGGLWRERRKDVRRIRRRRGRREEAKEETR